MLNKSEIFKYITPFSPVPTSLGRRGEPCKKIRAILFDLYGTLFISDAGDIGLAGAKSQKPLKIAELLREFGIKKSPEKILQHLSEKIHTTHAQLKEKGVDFPEVKIDLLWMDILSIHDPETVKKFAACYELIINQVYPMPHAEELLLACKNSGVLTGIISNAQFYTPWLFNWFFNSDSKEMGFSPELIFYSYIYGYGKPSMFMFNRAVEKLGEMKILPESVLYLGNDMLKDILPAKKAGFQTALFAGDKRSLRLREENQECQVITPDMIITDLAQLEDFI